VTAGDILIRITGFWGHQIFGGLQDNPKNTRLPNRIINDIDLMATND
jgi:hypothetical protein